MEKSINKMEALKNLPFSLKSVVVVFSGGVDSTFLLAVSIRVLKKELFSRLEKIRDKRGYHLILKDSEAVG